MQEAMWLGLLLSLVTQTYTTSLLLEWNGFSKAATHRTIPRKSILPGDEIIYQLYGNNY